MVLSSTKACYPQPPPCPLKTWVPEAKQDQRPVTTVAIKKGGGGHKLDKKKVGPCENFGKIRETSGKLRKTDGNFWTT